MMRKQAVLLVLVLVLTAAVPLAQPLNASLTVGQSLVAEQTLVSAEGIFALGFFTFWNNTYLGIWYNKMEPHHNAVWVANRDNPIKGNNGSLTLRASSLELVDTRGILVWSTGIILNTSSPLQALLLDSGNFIIINDTMSRTPILWQSFDHPCDTLLSGMRIGYDTLSNELLQLRSWNSDSSGQSPASGQYSMKLDPSRLPGLLLLRDDTDLLYRSGPWNGQRFSGQPNLKLTNKLVFNMTIREGSVHFWFTTLDTAARMHIVMDIDGVAHGLVYSSPNYEWVVIMEWPLNDCDSYAFCGQNAACYKSDCKCLQGFVPKSPSDWSMRNFTSGCVRNVSLSYSLSDGFYQLPHVKVPDTLNATLVRGKSLDDCRKLCLGNSSCSAYTLLGESNCVIWPGDLVDIAHVDEGINDLYARVFHSNPSHADTARKRLIMIIVPTTTGVVVVAIVLTLICLHRKQTDQMEDVLDDGMRGDNMYDQGKEHSSMELEEIGNGEGMDSKLYSYQVLQDATCHFSNSNKLGSGGFGTVYMGTFENGKQVAVKRLKDRKRNIQELEREISIVASLRHKNLVRFLGHCFETEERFLVYEYVPNSSLEKFWQNASFHSQKLDWATWFNIIKGIACGLRFLHKKGIIHRDLKPHNVLIDENLNPKIADFDLIRVYDKGKTHESTEKLAGTLGYMAPECTTFPKSQLSIKSDVYSYGVLVLEVITRHKIHTFEGQYCEGLVEYVWRHWTEKKVSDVVDSDMGVEEQQHALRQVLRCIHIALLCVQADPTRRPTMGQVIAMLSSEGVELQDPSLPGYIIHPKKGSAVLLPCLRCS